MWICASCKKEYQSWKEAVTVGKECCKHFALTGEIYSKSVQRRLAIQKAGEIKCKPNGKEQ